MRKLISSGVEPKSTIHFGNHAFDLNCPPFIIAEVGINHNGSLSEAKKLVDVAAGSGADAVKFQTFIAEDVVTKDAAMATYQQRNTGKTTTQLEMIRHWQLSDNEHIELRDYCQTKKITFLSTPHSGPRSADILDRVGVEAYKIGSGDLTNLPFLETLAKRSKLMIISTGMATLEEVREAVTTINEFRSPLIVMHCTSNYPCAPKDVNLKAMATIAKECDVSVGYSDHTLTIEAGVLATQLGALCLEKHITLSQELPGPDHKASMEPDAFRKYVAAVHATHQGNQSGIELDSKLIDTMMGSGVKKPVKSEIEIAQLVRKSLVAACDIPRGTRLTSDQICVKRPGTGIQPKSIGDVVGRIAANNIDADTLIDWSDLG